MYLKCPYLGKVAHFYALFTSILCFKPENVLKSGNVVDGGVMCPLLSFIVRMWVIFIHLLGKKCENVSIY